jgi:hypothetical protein
MDECQLYSALLKLEMPWKVNKVSLDPVKNVVDIFITHDKGSKLLCPICRKESMVYDDVDPLRSDSFLNSFEEFDMLIPPFLFFDPFFLKFFVLHDSRLKFIRCQVIQ